MGVLIEHLGVGVLGRRGETIVLANASLARLLGYASSTSLLGRSIWSIVHADARDEFRARSVASGTSGTSEPYLTRLTRANGAPEPVCIFPQHPLDDAAIDADPSPLIVETVVSLRELRGVLLPQPVAGNVQPCRSCLGHEAPPSSRRPPDSTPVVFEQLTQRESEIVQHIGQGADLNSVATQLGISPHTVRNHLKRIFRKLGIRSQTELLTRIIARERAQGRSHADESPRR